MTTLITTPVWIGEISKDSTLGWRAISYGLGKRNNQCSLSFCSLVGHSIANQLNLNMGKFGVTVYTQNTHRQTDTYV